MTDEEMRAAMAAQMQQMMTPDPEIEAMMGTQRKPQGDPSFAESIGGMGDMYRQMPAGPSGPMAMGQTPVIDPYAPRPMAQRQIPNRGLR